MVQPQDSTQRSAPSLLMVSPPLPLGHNIDYNMAQRVFGGEQKPDVIAGKLETQRRLPSDLDLVSGEQAAIFSLLINGGPKAEKETPLIKKRSAAAHGSLLGTRLSFLVGLRPAEFRRNFPVDRLS